MRLFKANPAAQSEADRARDLRLTSIASRYRPRSDTPPEPQPSEWAAFRAPVSAVARFKVM